MIRRNGDPTPLTFSRLHILTPSPSHPVITRTPAGAASLAEEQGKGFDLLFARRTYDLWSAFWPTVKTGLFAESLNAATKYVATHRPDSLSWGPHKHLGQDPFESIRQLKSNDGPDLIVWGSSTLTSLLLENELADEIVLITYPVLLGRGIRFFSEAAEPHELAFVSTRTTPTGVTVNKYRPVGSLRKRLSPRA